MKIPNKLAKVLIDSGYFGYVCEEGAIVGDKEFIIWADEKEYELLHKCQVEQKGIFIRRKE